MKIKIDKYKKHEVNRLLSKVMERARTAIGLINSDKPIDFFLGMGDVNELINDANIVKEFVKETWENQDVKKN